MLFNGVMKGNLDIVLVAKSLVWNWLSVRSNGQLAHSKVVWLSNPVEVLR